MDKWFRILAEERASAAGLRKSMGDLLDKGPQKDGSPYDEEDDEKPRLKKRNKKDISSPDVSAYAGNVGGIGAGTSAPSLEEGPKPDMRKKPEPTPFKSRAQKRYKTLRRKNDIYSQPSGHKNLSTGAPFNNNTKRAGTDRLRFEEEVEPESFEKNDQLEPHFWQDNKLDTKISNRLMRIANDFLESLEMPVETLDLRFTGSLANYNWSRYSDVDLHLVVDYSKIDLNSELVKAFFDASRMRWNELHDIKIYGYEVEVYVEDVDDVHRSSGVYSILKNEWIKEPDSSDVHFDFSIARAKSEDIITQVNMIEKFINKKPRSALIAIERLKNKIRSMRKAGLASDKQEFSAENIAFKILRREEVLDKLNNMKYDAYDSVMSMELR